LRWSFSDSFAEYLAFGGEGGCDRSLIVRLYALCPKLHAIKGKDQGERIKARE
jgi:hypothetical protein